jgi:uncharacterized protein YbaP (TraB family)
MVSLFAAAALTAATPALAPAQPAEPAMFVVRDADTTVYLFGTFHALDADQQWFGPGLRKAFEQSDELVLETLLPKSMPMRAAAVRVDQASVRPSASFLATTKIAISAGQSQGMQVGNGADMVLRHLAEDEGKSVGGLESLQFQLNMFNRIPAAARPATPTKRGAAQADQAIRDVSRDLAAMQSAWKRGDQSLFANLLTQLRTGSPAMYRTMFTERNARWAEWISGRMQAPGTVFVAVGAGHLIGPDSLLVRLAERGIASQRVN